MATETELRNNVVAWAEKYLGIAEGGTKHKELISIFNDSGLCSRYKMTTSDPWCAMFTSDAFIANNLTSRCFPCVECSCASMITLAKNNNLWVEDDDYTPQKGDVILYDWDDSSNYATTDDKNNPDHVGIVASAPSSNKSFQVIEGNKSDTVGYRSMTVNGRYIRGYIVPDYQAASDGSSSTSGTTGTKTITEIAEEVIEGKWGNGDTRKQKLEAAGYDYSEVQAKVNELLGKSSSGSSGGSSSGSSLPSYSTGKSYTVQVDHLAVRTGAGTGYSKKSKSQLTSDGQKHAYTDGCLKKGTKVTCQATKTVNGNVWMQIPSGWCAAYYNSNKYIK